MKLRWEVHRHVSAAARLPWPQRMTNTAAGETFDSRGVRRRRIIRRPLTSPMQLRLPPLSLLLVGVCVACAGRAAPSAFGSARSTSTDDWLARQTVYCGEVRGRVLNAQTGAPLTDAYVTIDSVRRGVSTDSLGQFRFMLHSPKDAQPAGTRPTFVRIRRIGMTELGFYLPTDVGYAVEASIMTNAFHMDHFSTVRIKSPGFCVPPGSTY